MKQATEFAKTNRSLILGLFFLLGAAQLPAQDLHMYYNLFTDSISYKKDGAAVKNPKIRKGDFIILHFTEFNPYIYQAQVDIEQRNSDDWDGGASNGSLSPAGTLFPLLSGQASGGAKSLNIFDLPLLGMGENSLRLRDLFPGARSGEKDLMDQAHAKLEALAKIQAEMADIHKKLEVMDKSEQYAQLAAKHLEQLLHDPHVRPSVIRRVAAEYEHIIFPEKPANTLTLDEAYEWQKRPVEKKRLMNELEAKQLEFEMQIVELAPITQQLSALDVGSSAFENFTADLRDVTGNAGSLREQLEAYLESQLNAATPHLSLEDMLALQLKFRELADQPFSYDVAISMEKNNVITTARFAPIDSLSTSAKAQRASTKVKTVKITAQGGLRISTGFGVGFARMFEPAQDYSVRNNTIVADDSGIAQPALSTYIHFYPGNRSGFGVAGTFGVGIPLSNSNLTSLNFFLGPSLLFGRGQRIVLSGGLTAGPTKRLGKGYNIGDAFDPNAGDIPTRTGYDLGYFLGISFSIQ